MYFLSHKRTKECERALKALSAVIITIYGYNAEKVILYLLVCKPAIELMLQSELEMLHKEVYIFFNILLYLIDIIFI